MPWKFIIILLIVTLLALFTGINTHKITINFGLFTLTDIPLFVALISSFILGAFTALPFSIVKSFQRKKKVKKTTLINNNQGLRSQDSLVPEQELPGTESSETPLTRESGDDNQVVPPRGKEKKTRKKTKKK